MALGSARPSFGSRQRGGQPAAGMLARLTEELHTFADLAADGCRVVVGRMDEPATIPRLALEIGRETTRLVDGARPGAPLAWISTADGERIASQTQDLIARLGLSRADLAISFADDVCLDLEFTMPKAPRGALEQAIAAEAARQMPYVADEGLAFWSVSRKAGPDVEARIAFVPAHVVGPVLEALARLDVRPSVAMRATAAGAWTAQPAWLGLPRDRNSTVMTRIASLPRPARLALAASAIVFGSLLINMAVNQWQISTLSAAAQQAADAARLAGKRETDAAFLAARQRDALTRLQILNELAARIPDGNWFERIDVKDDKVEFTGHAVSAADTLRLIASLPGVRTAELMSAVTRDRSRNLERFRLLSQIGKGPREPAAARPVGGAP